MKILQAKEVTKRFGELAAVKDLTFEVEKGEIFGIAGPIGSGKTTLFNLITGFYKPDGGNITFKGEPIGGLSLNQTFRKGLCRTFQISRELKLMTVLENLMLVPKGQFGESLWRAWFLPLKVKKQEQEIRDRAMGTLAAVGLAELKDEYAGNLSGGQKRLLELARTMMANPEMILFDEPGAGVNPTERRTLADRIRSLVNDSGVTVLLIGHEMELVMDVCDPIIVLDRGKKLTEGTPDEVRNDKRVLEVYLGGGAA